MRKLTFGFWCILILDVLLVKVKSDNCDIEIERTLRALLSPQEYPTLQLQSLRRQLVHKIQQALEKIEEEEDPNLKRSLSALARWNNLPEKRNIEALARAGYIRTLPDIEEGNDSYKRSIANLAKNGQLPTHEEKRGIQSLARNGEIHSRISGSDASDEDYYVKRNLASLARNYNFPSFYKRSISSLARSGDLPSFYKRNVAALLRQDSYLNEHNHDIGTEVPDMEKRNIASIKAQYNPKFKRSTLRSKRQAEFDDNVEYPSPVYQNTNVYDYEDLMKYFTGAYPETEKRFLGSVARSGWFRPTGSRITRFNNSPDKRHIGSLARLGWLPTLRNIRRFNRSGRSTCPQQCREASTDGETKVDSFSENSIPLDNKRVLLQSALDNILFRKIHPMHPRAL